jgi:hypothetical protein
MLMDKLEKRDLKNHLRVRFAEMTDEERDILADLVDESLELMERHGYRWESVRELMLEEFGATDGGEVLKNLREHLSIYREFRNLK